MEDRTADFCVIQRELVFYVGKRLGVESASFVGAMDSHSAVTNRVQKAVLLNIFTNNTQ